MLETREASNIKVPALFKFAVAPVSVELSLWKAPVCPLSLLLTNLEVPVILGNPALVLIL